VPQQPRSGGGRPRGGGGGGGGPRALTAAGTTSASTTIESLGLRRKGGQQGRGEVGLSPERLEEGRVRQEEGLGDGGEVVRGLKAQWPESWRANQRRHTTIRKRNLCLLLSLVLEVST
jgi:hypothetical protein